MAYKTYLNAVNEVQRRLRETVTASVTTTDYSRLIGIFVNEAKREVEDAWNWNSLRDTITATTVAGTRAYVLTNSRNRFRVLDVYNDTEDYFVCPIQTSNQTNNFLSSTQQGKPMWYSFNAEYLGDAVIDLFPTPDAVYAINFNLVIPQAELDTDTDEIWAPYEPIVIGAYMKAMGERGEDTGDGYQRAMGAYNVALGNAISQDEARMPGETIFYAV